MELTTQLIDIKEYESKNKCDIKNYSESIYVTKSFLPPIDEYKKLLDRIWESNCVTNNGPIHKEFKIELSKYLKNESVELFTNGHLALDIAIKSMNLTGEVITTPFTFASTTHAIVSNGLKPVFCDINMDDFTIDTQKIEELITDKTSAIIPVHVFGYPCNLDKIQEIADKHNLKVIYDAAHVFGVKVDGEPIGNFGDISMFSLHATKVYNSIEGGLLVFKNKELGQKLNMIRNFGIEGPESVKMIGQNAKMNEFQAAMGLLNLKYLNEQIEKRKKIADIYREELDIVDGIHFLQDKDGVDHNYSYFPILIDKEKVGINRDEIFEELQLYGIYTRKYFYPLVTEFECYKNIYEDSHLTNAKYIAKNILTLPIYGELAQGDAYRIVELIKHIIKTKQ